VSRTRSEAQVLPRMGKHDDLCMTEWCSGFYFFFLLRHPVLPYMVFRRWVLCIIGVVFFTAYSRAGICDMGKCGLLIFVFHSMPMQNMVHSSQFYGTEYSVCRASGVVDRKETQRQGELGIIGKFHQRASCLGNSYPTLRSPPALREPHLGRSGVPSQRELPSCVHTPDVAG
jgi:hypothetical protein